MKERFLNKYKIFLTGAAVYYTPSLRSTEKLPKW